MARTNKYTSLNFNEIYEKKFTKSNNRTGNTAAQQNNTSSSLTTNSNNASKTILSNSRIQGHMLVLSRPTPKPISIPERVPVQQHQHHQQNQPEGRDLREKLQALKLSPTPSDQNGPDSDSISLRPQGRTGTAPAPISSPLISPGVPTSPLASPLKSNKFVPPHLRPGFVGREEKPAVGRGVVNRETSAAGNRHVHYGSSPNRFGENGRPKSGGGYDRTRRGAVGIGGGSVVGEVDPVYFTNRPGSSGARPSSSGYWPGG